MKSVVFSEEQFADLDKIGKELFEDEKDPRSRLYVRKLQRPTINWLRVILNLLIPIIVLSAMIFALKKLGVSTALTVVVAVVSLTVYLCLRMKSAVICAVRIYQRYAPASLRNKCRFEPSCSEYMILSIEKFGLCKGLRKGINRLKRCNIHGGGFDIP